MVRKLLLLLLLTFAFAEISAQANILTHTVDCGFVGEDVYYEWEYNGETDWTGSDDRMSFRRLNTPNSDIITYPTGWIETVPGATAVLASGSAARIEWDSANTRWVYRNGSTVIFENANNTSSPPADGWTTAISCPSGDSTDNFSAVASADGTVLPVERRELDKVALYPNPADGFVRISNLEDNTRVMITNITGQVVRNVELDRTNNSIDVQGLAKGFYFVEIEGKKTIKLVKK